MGKELRKVWKERNVPQYFRALEKEIFVSELDGEEVHSWVVKWGDCNPYQSFEDSRLSAQFFKDYDEAKKFYLNTKKHHARLCV
jgi:hypothetical protein